MLQPLLDNYGMPLAYDVQKLYCFWEPEAVEAVTEQELRALKVGYRAQSIKRVTEAFVSGEVDEFELRTKSREEQRQALLNLYGIGPARRVPDAGRPLLLGGPVLEVEERARRMAGKVDPTVKSTSHSRRFTR